MTFRRKIYEEKLKIFRAVNSISDILLTVIAWQGAFMLREFLWDQKVVGFKALQGGDHGWLVFGAIAVFAVPVLFKINKLYPTSRLKKPSDVVIRIFKSVLELILLFMMVSFVFHVCPANRSLIFIFGFMLFAIFSIKEYLVKKIFFILIKKHAQFKTCIVIGRPKEVGVILEKLQGRDLGLRVEGVIYTGEDNKEAKEQSAKSRILGHLDDLELILEDKSVELVIIASNLGFEEYIENIIFTCEERGVEVWLKYTFFDLRIAKVDSGYLDNVPMLIFSSTPPYNWDLFVKTLFDLVLCLMFLPIFGIFFIFIGIGIKISSPGPILFRQKRGGLYGKPFIFYKFRTMYKDAEQRREELQKFNMVKGPAFKIKNDPRVFAFGRFLRKTSLDELPQLLNVLKGDMSIVGPRPALFNQDDLVALRTEKGVHQMIPGITGWAQTHGRDEIPIPVKVELDEHYLKKQSLWLDMKILMLSLQQAFSGKDVSH